MICRHCAALFRLNIRSHAPSSQQLRFLATSIQNSQSTSPAAATSTSAAQPFSTPFTPSPSKLPPSTFRKDPAGPPAPKSSLPAGTPLRGLNYIRNADAPVAKEDSEYPPWLWTLLSPSSSSASSSSNADQAIGDAFAKSKKQRRLASKVARAKLSGDGGEAVREVKLHEQSVDLASGMEGEAQKRGSEEREELKRSMRGARRKGIKEANFLKGMR